MWGNTGINVAVCTRSSRSWFINVILYQKESGSLGEMTDSWAGTESPQDAPGTLLMPESKLVPDEECQEDTEFSLKGCPLTKTRIVCTSKWITKATDNWLSKTGLWVHTDITKWINKSTDKTFLIVTLFFQIKVEEIVKIEIHHLTKIHTNHPMIKGW